MARGRRDPEVSSAAADCTLGYCRSFPPV